jgi:alkanesulfonate monooxygenase SsuD/methylene tetrahydromethanopterin reductase-like flavin-dependent oxidoreductase (luciferase family)
MASMGPQPHPFRFLASLNDDSQFAELTSVARHAEAVGCAAFVLPDHLMSYDPIVPLAMVAAATERLRVGNFVLNVRTPPAAPRSSRTNRAPRRAAAPTGSGSRPASS